MFHLSACSQSSPCNYLSVHPTESQSRLDVPDVPGEDPHHPDFAGERNPDIDYVLTTRELAHMLRINQVNECEFVCLRY